MQMPLYLIDDSLFHGVLCGKQTNTLPILRSSEWVASSVPSISDCVLRLFSVEAGKRPKVGGFFSCHVYVKTERTSRKRMRNHETLMNSKSK